jgi:hypothetical protein
MKLLWPLALLTLLGVTGCVTPGRDVRLTGNIFVDAPMMITNGPAGDRILWEDRLALAALRHGDFALARRSLDNVLLNSGGISGDGSARLARSYFHPESTKRFIGEPYERVMAFYYRGLLYWMDGEPDNARACFRSAAIQDADNENHEYSADYVVLDYLEGLTTLKLAGDGSDAIKRAQKEVRASRPPPPNPKANLLFFLEFSPGPLKFASGEYREQLHFSVERPLAQSAEVVVDGQALRTGPWDDLYFQATTRGGRVMDHILANKAVFKSATDIAGNIGILGGAVAALQNNRTSQEVGLGLIAAGLISKVISASTTPEADLRAWDNLPRYLGFGAMEVSPGSHTATVYFRDGSGVLLPRLTKTLTLNVPADGNDKVVFVSDQSTSPQNL